jgi:hypothetical protein
MIFILEVQEIFREYIIILKETADKERYYIRRN